MEPLCASLSSRDKPDVCFTLSNLLPNPISDLVSLCLAETLHEGGGVCRDFRVTIPSAVSPGPPQEGLSSVTLQPSGSRSLLPLPRPPLAPSTAQTHSCAGTWGSAA